MNLHYDTVSQSLMDYLKRLTTHSAFMDFILVGGTALSLQRGHRRSIDIDLFTDLPYGEMPLKEMQDAIKSEFDFHYGLESLDSTLPGYTLRIGDTTDTLIKLDLYYTEPFIYRPLTVGNVKIADERDIAAMKMLAITSDFKRQKDFWDIHELLTDYSLHDLIDCALRRYPYSIDREAIVKGLQSLDEADDDVIDSLKFNFWELVKIDLENAVRGMGEDELKAGDCR